MRLGFKWLYHYRHSGYLKCKRRYDLYRNYRRGIYAIVKSRILFVFLVIAGLTLAFYANSLNNPFIWDDEALIVKNPVIRSFAGLAQAFTTNLYSGTGHTSNFYRPLQTASYIWDYHFWRLDPFGFHLTNIILQILVAFLVFLFIRVILGEVKIAFGSALLFALSPLHTEAVTYISGRAEMLMGFFLLSAFLLFSAGRRILSWVAFIGALLSKELAVVFPLVILAYLFYCRRETPKKIRVFLKVALPFFIIDLVYLALRIKFFDFSAAQRAALAQTPLILKITVLPEIIFTYFKLLIFPSGLHMGWILNRPHGPWSLFINWFLIAAISLGCVYIFKNRGKKAGAFMLAWALIFFLPQSGLLPINALIAEHFIYLSSISFFAVLVYLLHKYLRHSVFIFSILGLAAFYGMFTSIRNSDWKDPLSFYGKIIRLSPNSFMAHNNLGLQYEYRYLYSQAMRQYRQALEINPDSIEARSNLANIYFKMLMFKEAKAEYLRLEKILPKEKAGNLWNNIGCIYQVEGFLDEALEKYRFALSLDQKLNFAHFNIAKIYLIRGERDLALQEIFASLPELNSATVEERTRCREIIEGQIKHFKDLPLAQVFYYDLGVSFIVDNQPSGAIAAFMRVLELDPLYDQAHFNLGLAYAKRGLRKEAILEFKSALKINPDHAAARESLAEIVHKNN